MTAPIGSRTSTAQATLLILFSACCFGSIGILISLGLESGAPLIGLLAWRYVVAALLLAVVAGGVPPLRAIGRRAWPLLLLAGGGQAAIAFISLSALTYIPAASVTFVFYTYPAWVSIIGALRGTDRLTARGIVALVLSLSGLALMIGTPGAGGLNVTGVALALTAAVIYALYIPMINSLASGMHPAVSSAFAAGGAGIIFVAAALFTGVPMLGYAPMGWTSIALLAVVSTVLAFIAFLRGLAVIGPVRTAIISTIEPFWTALLGSVVLGQALGPRVFIGGVLIAAAVVVLQLRQRS